MIATPIAVAAALVLSSAAHAQMPGEVIIEVDQPVLMPGESTSVTLLAGFDGDADFAMAAILTNLLADAGGIDVSSAWSEVALVSPMDGPGTTPGMPETGGYAGIIAGQLNFPPAGFGPDESNPIAFWEATFTAPIDAGVFTVDLSTRTERFEVYIARGNPAAESRLDGLTEGAAAITIIPAPAGALVLAGLFFTRRRR